LVKRTLSHKKHKRDACSKRGTSPYTFKLNNKKVQSSNVFNNLRAGSYLLIITDANGCTKSVTFSISQPTKLKLVVVQKIKPSCKGGSDGSIEVVGVGGTGASDYEELAGRNHFALGQPTWKEDAGYILKWIDKMVQL
jgi:hypothetical protein